MTDSAKDPAEKIAKAADDVRASGMPDALNRWLDMTPEKLAAAEAAGAALKKVRGPGRKLVMPGKSKKAPLDMPKSIEPAGLALKKEIDAANAAKTKARFAALKERNMKPGPKEMMLKQAREAKRRPAIEAPKAPAPAKPDAVKAAQTETTMKTSKTKKTSKPKTAAKAARTPSAKAGTRKPAKDAAAASARTPISASPDGVRPGSKLETIVGLLKRPEGCTTADVLAATGWPAVSMPQQAKQAGLTLKKEKDGKVTRYRAE